MTFQEVTGSGAVLLWLVLPGTRWRRDEAPLYWDPVQKLWVISRYDDVLEVEKAAGRYCSSEGSRPLVDQGQRQILIERPGLLATTAVDEFIRWVLRRMPDWELACPAEPRIVPATFTRAYDRIRITFTPGRP